MPNITEEKWIEMLEKKADGTYIIKYPKVKSKSGITFDEHLADNTPHREAVTLHRKNKDENGIFTRLEWYRADGTLFKTSELEGESPQYAIRRVKFYAQNGQTLVQEIVYILTYDENGELISEVIQK